MSAPHPDPAELAESGLALRVDGAVATITLSRPDKLNAQDPAMWLGLSRISSSLSGEVRVAVIKGEGRAFSAGLDRGQMAQLATLGSTSEHEALALIASYQEGFSCWRRNDLLTVAQVHGHAIGAGFQLALACDLRVIADDTLFCMAEPSLGLVPDLGGTKPLVDLVGYPRALEICATSRRVGADEAVRLGLAELAVPATELDQAVDDLVQALLAAPRDAVIETKALLRGAATRTHEAQLLAEREAQLRRLRDLVRGVE